MTNTLALYLYNGPLYVHADPGKENEMADWLLSVMKHNGVAIFKDDEGRTRSAIRGSAILGFGFEQIDNNSEIQRLHERRLSLEVDLMEMNLKNLRDQRSGDAWKDGYDDGY